MPAAAAAAEGGAGRAGGGVVVWGGSRQAGVRAGGRVRMHASARCLHVQACSAGGESQREGPTCGAGPPQQRLPAAAPRHSHLRECLEERELRAPASSHRDAACAQLWLVHARIGTHAAPIAAAIARWAAPAGCRVQACRGMLLGDAPCRMARPRALNACWCLMAGLANSRPPKERV